MLQDLRYGVRTLACSPGRWRDITFPAPPASIRQWHSGRIRTCPAIPLFLFNPHGLPFRVDSRRAILGGTLEIDVRLVDGAQDAARRREIIQQHSTRIACSRRRVRMPLRQRSGC